MAENLDPAPGNDQQTTDLVKLNEFYLNYAKFVWEKIKLQRETTDRYFNYYLLLITTPIVAFAAIVGKDHGSIIREQILGYLSLLLFVIGVCFFCLYVRQRVNNLILGAELTSMTMKIAKTGIMKTKKGKNDGLIVNGLTGALNPITADFWVNMIQVIINSFWLTNALLYIDAGFQFNPLWSKIIPCFWGLTCILMHILLRDLRLYKMEKRNPLVLTWAFYGMLNRNWKKKYARKIGRSINRFKKNHRRYYVLQRIAFKV